MTLTLKLAAPPSDQEILDLSRRNPGLRFERGPGGDLIVTPTGSKGGRREAELVAQLHRWAREHGGATFGASAGFRLPDGSLLSPDASWVRQERWEAMSPEDQERFAPLCPDAVFEIASRTDALADLRAKMHVYLANGAQIAVLIDPFNRKVEVFARGQASKVIEGAGQITLEPALPGFTLDLSPIFA
ncbi:MAG: Uma2 family endonuclease [Armatimonadetes bacterium]|nr:Uma2 family endonuclease [Armatimonadota bacterium]